MKKLSLYVFLVLMFCNAGYAKDIKKLNKKLLEIEARLDKCLDTKDKDICMDFMTENPMMSQNIDSKIEEAQKLRDAGMKAHDAGDHAKSEELLNKALELFKI